MAYPNIAHWRWKPFNFRFACIYGGISLWSSRSRCFKVSKPYAEHHVGWNFHFRTHMLQVWGNRRNVRDAMREKTAKQ